MADRAFACLDFDVLLFEIAVRRAVEAGLDAAAILDAKGELLAIAGGLASHQARAIAAHAMRSDLAPDLVDRLLRGETISMKIGDRVTSIGVAARCVFYVVVFPRDLPGDATLAPVYELRADIERRVRDARLTQVPPSGSGGSSGPAELPVIEIGITVRRSGRN